VSSRRTSVVVVLLLGALAAVWWFGLVQPARDEADALAEQRASLQNNVDDLEAQVEQARIDEVVAGYPAELNLVEERTAADNLSVQLDEVLATTSMTRDVLSMGDTEDFTDDTHLVEFRIVLAGDANEAALVVAELEKRLPYLAVTSLSAEDSAAQGQGVSTITGMLLVSNVNE